LRLSQSEATRIWDTEHPLNHFFGPAQTAKFPGLPMPMCPCPALKSAKAPTGYLAKKIAISLESFLTRQNRLGTVLLTTPGHSNTYLYPTISITSATVELLH
jgi:hypothetical protein